MKDLIERLEKATGPDRELDRDIAIATGWWQVETNAGLDWRRPQGGSHGLPDYTVSLDAALTLVPEGWWVELRLNGAFCHCELEYVGERNIGPIEHNNAPTPALAVCAPAMKARIAVERDLTKMEAGR